MTPQDPPIPRRVAMLSVHTSPLEQPGTGDAGGLNVYVVETAKRLAERGTQVEVFTRATRSDQPSIVEMTDGVVVRHITAGPFEGLGKQDLPAQLCAFAAGVMRIEARMEPGWYDLIHSHYWLSGQVGWLAAERWRTPLVHTMHTMAKVKNAALAEGDTPEPAVRIIGEEQVVAAADALLANTADERRELIELYGGDPAKVHVVPPGVDLNTFTPGGPDGRMTARRALGLDPQAQIVLFVGRIQPLKAPDVLVRAIAAVRAYDAHRAVNTSSGQPSQPRRLVLAILGGLSGNGLEHPDGLRTLVADLGLHDVVQFHPPVDRAALAQWYRAADVVAVPSYNESFGLVAVEAQACGTPVIAAAVGGLRTAVADQHSGILVPGHDPELWGQTLADLLDDPTRRAALARGAVRHSMRFSWESTTDTLLSVYGQAITAHQANLEPRRALRSLPERADDRVAEPLHPSSALSAAVGR